MIALETAARALDSFRHLPMDQLVALFHAIDTAPDPQTFAEVADLPLDGGFLPHPLTLADVMYPPPAAPTDVQILIALNAAANHIVIKTPIPKERRA